MASIPGCFEPKSYHVIHPLNDVPEQKCSSEGLGQIAMTRPVRISLGLLRGYLVVMSLMLVYHVLELAGVFHTIR